MLNRALLDEVDEPMLRHGLQEMHGRTIDLPGRLLDQPDREGVARRLEEFLAAG